MTWPSTGRPTPCRSRSPARTRKIRFSGSAGQDVSIDLASSVADTDFQLLKPNGNELTSGSFDSLGRLPRSDLAAHVDGTYKLVLDPQSFSLGNRHRHAL